MTPKEASQLITLAQLSGMEPDPSIAANLRGAATVYAQVLTAAGVSYAEAEAAVLAVSSEPWTSEYRRRVPSTGEIIARTPAARLAAQLASAAEVDRAWADFERRMHVLSSFGGPREEDPRRQLDMDPDRNDAMWDAFDACGGYAAWCRRAEDDRSYPARWRTVFADERKRQAEHLPTVRKMLGGPTARRLLLGVDNG